MADWGSSLKKGAAMAGTGAAVGSAAGPWGTAIGAAVGFTAGTVGGLISSSKEEKLIAAAKDKMNALPDFRESEAYLNAATQAGRADRWADEGFTAQQRSLVEQNVNRVGAIQLENAATLESGLQGMSTATQSLSDAYLNIAMQDANLKQGNRQTALMAQRNFENAQKEAAALDIAKQQNMIDFDLGEIEAFRKDSKATQQNIQTGTQSMLDSGAFNQLANKWGGANGGGAVSSQISHTNPYATPQLNSTMYSAPSLNSTFGQGANTGGFGQGNSGLVNYKLNYNRHGFQ